MALSPREQAHFAALEVRLDKYALFVSGAMAIAFLIQIHRHWPAFGIALRAVTVGLFAILLVAPFLIWPPRTRSKGRFRRAQMLFLVYTAVMTAMMQAVILSSR